MTKWFFFLFNARTQRTSSPSTYIIILFRLFFSVVSCSHHLKIKCISITKLQMRKAYCIAFPQTARLPNFCTLFSLSFLISSFTGDTRGFRHKWISLAQWSSTFSSHYLENVFNHALIFFVYSHPFFWFISQTMISRLKRIFV